LTINPGVSISFTNGASLTVNGTLNAVGTAAEPITFTSPGSVTPGSWGNIVFNGSGAASSIISYANIQYGGGIQFLSGANATLENSTISNCTQGVYIYQAAPSITNNQINNCIQGVYIYQAAPQIQNNQITDPLTNGIYLDAPGYAPSIIANTIVKSSGNSTYYQYHGILIVSNALPDIGSNEIAGFDHGIYSGGGSVTYCISSENPNQNNLITNICME
jgi:parallel beta-helix repeat protein